MPIIRLYTGADLAEWRRMRRGIWPGVADGDADAWLARDDAITVVAEQGPGALCGFAEAGERAYADGCETSPVAYLEGWYVDPEYRRQSIGAALLRAVEAWGRTRGYRELASDTQLENVLSQRAHERLGFTETERLVLFRKTL